MSRCPAHELLERFLARRLDPPDHAATADHVRGCPQCRSACARLAAALSADTVTLERPPPPPPAPPDAGQPAPADAPTARLWRHELHLRTGERPVQGGSDFDIALRPWPSAHRAPAVPGYEILGELGRGGMGVVFKAKQVRLNRLVALKMIHAGELTDPDTLGRFRTEAEAVARLQHPNIVQIYEVGEADGRPFFSLEYVAGGSLSQRAGGRPQPPAAAAALIETLARTIHYAHTQGVVHRDLKPGNVLLADCGVRGGDSDPDAAGKLSDAVSQSATRTPHAAIKVADFGLAKYTAAATPGRPDNPTRRGLIVGTPQYMAPEQAAATPETVGPAADVYSLGAILYELLTGRPPFQGANAMDTLLQVRLLEPIPPRVWQAKVPRDLETVCLKCLQKEPRHRYASARDLAEDLRLYLDGEPIRARPASVTERAWKAARRHPAVAALGLVAALAVVVGFAGMAWQWRQAEGRRAAAEQARAATATALDATERELYVSRIAQAHDAVRAGDVARAAELLRLCRPDEDRPDRRGWEWHYLCRACAAGRDPGPQVAANPPGEVAVSAFRGPAADAAVSPDGRFTAAARDGAAVVTDAATGAVVARPVAPVPVSAVAFSPDGRRLAGVGGVPAERVAAVVLWDTATWEAVLTLRLPAAGSTGAGLRRVAFSRDGRRLTAAGPGGVLVWDAGESAAGGR